MILRGLILFASLLLWSCANQTQPTGGPRDEDPPLLISSAPESGALNYNSQTIQLEFNEMIKADKLQNELIITPSIQFKFKSRVVKNRVTLTFDEPFNDSTTYTLNFREAIQDVTESNPAEDLILVFSTGPIIDSLQLSGTVTSLLKNQPVEKYTVGLYSAEDTLTFLDAPPLYAIQTEKDGTFQFRNIKAAVYNVYTWEDKNNDLECQTENEPYGFLTNSIQLDSNITNIDFYTQFLNIKPLTITAARQQGQYFEARFSKPTNSYSLTPLTPVDSLYHHYIDDKRAFRIYNTFQSEQELNLLLSAIDSAGFTVYDTLLFTFEETSRPPDQFLAQIKSATLKSNTLELESILQFNKPIKPFLDSSWHIGFDSAFYDLSEFAPTWAWDENELTIKANVPDSLTKKNDLVVSFSAHAFESIESDSSDYLTQKVRQLNPDNFGMIELTIEQDSTPFFVHLLDDKGVFQNEYLGQRAMSLEYLQEGQYQIRILLDMNKDGVWQPGNFLNNQLPEPVIFFFDEEANTSTFLLKQNWVLGPFTIPLTVDN